MDLSADGLRYARDMGVANPVQGDTCHLGFASSAFDLVLSMECCRTCRPLEAQAVNEMARVLAPGGLLAIRAAALDMLRSRHSAFAFERQRFTRARLMGLAQDAGLRVLRCTYTNSLLLPVAFAKFRVWEPLLRKPPASGIDPVPAWLDSLLYSALKLEASFLGAGGSFPVGQSLVLIGKNRGEVCLPERILSGIQRRALAAAPVAEDFRHARNLCHGLRSDRGERWQS